jgi:hypothetical protein
MVGNWIRQQVENAFTHGRGHTEDKLNSLLEQLEETAEDENEDEAHREAASQDSQYVKGVLETPGPFLTDLAFIRRKRR